MPTITIDVDFTQQELNVLNAIAKQAGKSTKEYCINIVRNFARSKMKAVYQAEFNKKSLSELENLFGIIGK